MALSALGIEIYEGDYVVDPWDGEVRQVEEINGDALYMVDGGIMTSYEVNEIKLASEVE